jgi:electron transfer flavoprotein beta subunit
MDIVVCVKQSYDVQQLKFDPATGEPMLAGAPKKMSDMDKRALEEALKIKETAGGKVVAVTAGGGEVKEVVKEIYAMGADEVYAVMDDALKDADTTAIAKVLAAAIQKVGNYDLVLCGAASTDGYSWQVPAKIAANLGIPILPNAVSLKVEDGKVITESDLGDAVYVYSSDLPAVVSVMLEINEPRIPKLSAILKASRKPFNQLSLSDLGVDVDAKMEVLSARMPKVARKNVVFDASDAAKVDEAVSKLVEELHKENLI